MTIDGPLLRCNIMHGPHAEITIAEDEPEIADRIEAELLHSLRSALPQAPNTSFVLSARAPDGALVGGLSAGTSYGWLLV
ncbi:MAG: hypothetical protein ACR2P3_04410, partial [Geminicoccaceae bacterium]